MNRVFKWEGKTVTFPTSLKWAFNEISSESSGRSKNGKMHKKVVAKKRTLECSWIALEDSQAKALLSAIKNQTFGKLTYPDAFAGADLTKTFYTDDAEAEAIFLSSKGVYTWNISFSFIEQ